MDDRTIIPLDAETKVSERPDDHKTELRLWLRLLTCTTLIENEVRRRLRDQFDSTLPRFDLLAQLDRAPDGMTLGELSQRMMVSNGNITGLVDRLAEQGLIRRRPSPNDRRVQIVNLTPEGQKFFRTMARVNADWVGEIFADSEAPPTKQQRFDETETGEAKAVSIVEVEPGAMGEMSAETLAAQLGLATGDNGVVGHETFESIYAPGKLLLLVSWRSAAAAAAFSPKLPPGAKTLRHRGVRIIRDYGMFERREAPQFYREARRSSHS